MKKTFDPSLYLVTDSELCAASTLEEGVRRALRGGCTLVQLREKNLLFDDFCAVATRIKRVTDGFGIPLIINDRADVAAAVGAAGVHIGQSDGSVKVVRERIGEDKILGVSAATLAQARQAEAEGADYLGVGAMYPTGTKTDARIVTFSELKEIVTRCKVPVVAIGGINEQTVSDFVNCPLDGIAVVSAIIAAKDAESAARHMKKLFNENHIPVLRGVSACVFDLDGTLLESLGVWDEVDRLFLQKRGLTETEDYKSAICAMSFSEAAAYTVEKYSLSETADDVMREWHNIAAREYEYNVGLKPYAKEYLSALKSVGVKLAVATSLGRGMFEPALKRNGIYDLFDAFCSVDDVGLGKESPDVFRLAAETVGADPAECVVFEDVLPAIKSAKTAGARVCGVFDSHSAGDWSEIVKLSDCTAERLDRAPVIVGK